MALLAPRRLATLAAAGVVAVASLMAGGAAAVAAPSTARTSTPSTVQARQATLDGFYITSFDGAIYQVSTGAPRHLTFDEWAAAGFPNPDPAPTSFLKYSWAPVIFAQTRWGDATSTWATTAIDYTQWTRAGRPTPQTVGWIVDAGGIIKYATSDELFNIVIGTDDSYWAHKLTYSDWQASGFEPPYVYSNVGFLKLSWHQEIVYFPDLSSKTDAVALTYADWRSTDFATPQSRPTLPGDVFCLYGTSPTVVYDGAAGTFAITYAQWTAAGRPAPQHC